MWAFRSVLSRRKEAVLKAALFLPLSALLALYTLTHTRTVAHTQRWLSLDAKVNVILSEFTELHSSFV